MPSRTGSSKKHNQSLVRKQSFAAMTTLILSPRFSSDSSDLWRAVNSRSDWDSYRAINHIAPENVDDCCVYGELLFCDIMADRCGLGLLDPADSWLSQLPQRLTKRKIEYWEAKHLFRIYEKKFIKPANDKVFQCAVYQKGTDVPLRHISDYCPCLVSEVVDFDIEVRFWILNGQPVTWDYYRLIGDISEESARADAHEFCLEVLKEEAHNLPSACTLDIGHISDRGWAVVEANQAYSSGIYNETDCSKVLDVLKVASGPMKNVSDRDKKFLRNR